MSILGKASAPIDVCIIGCGPGGAILGAALAREGIEVVVLESGPRHPFSQRAQYHRDYVSRGIDPWIRKPESIDVFSNAGPMEYPLNELRVRGVGGSSLHWQAETPRLQAGDFRMRSLHGVSQDWPITYDELEPFYVRAEHELGVAGGEDPFASPRSAPYPMPPLPFNYLERQVMASAKRLGLRFNPIPQARNSRPYSGRSQCLGCSTCNVCPVGAKASVDLTHVPLIETSRHGRIVENATVQRLESNRAGIVTRAVYAGLDRVEHAIEASLFVIAGGGVETPRLLLLSAGRDASGLANSSGLVGKGLREHPLCFMSGRMDSPTYSHRISFYAATCNQFWNIPERAERAAFTIFIGPQAGPSPFQIARASSLWGDRLAQHIREEFGHTVTLECPIDMLSYDHNAVDLDPDLRDYFGNPAPRITLGWGEYEEAGIRAAQRMQTEVLEAHGARAITPGAAVGFMAHPAGTCRMGGDPKRSVVDPTLRCHDVPNLYLVGTSVFVTGGLANPTLTIAALALRLGDHLLRQRGMGKPA